MCVFGSKRVRTYTPNKSVDLALQSNCETMPTVKELYRLSFETIARPSMTSMESMSYAFLIQLDVSQCDSDGSGELVLDWMRDERVYYDGMEDEIINAQLILKGSDNFYSTETYWTLLVEECTCDCFDIEFRYVPSTHTWTLGYVHQACDSRNTPTCHFSVTKVDSSEVPECVTS